MKKRIYTFLRGGLGNQMFIYAAVRAAQLRYLDGEGEMLFSCQNYRKFMNPEESAWYAQLLTHFQISSCTQIVESFRLPVTKRILKKLCGYRWCKNSKEVYEKAVRTAGFLQRFGVISCESGFIPMAEKMPHVIYMDSFFQSEEYFREIRPILQKEFSLADMPSKPAQEMSERMQREESVCLAVRLGDYINHPMHYVCTPDYYNQAIEKMKQMCPDSVFYLFSDDIQMAEKLLKLPDVYVKEPACATPNETLWVMSHCKHFIISNSSFHWWAQYLGTDSQKVVIAPKRWYAQDIPCAIYQDNWTVIDV